MTGKLLKMIDSPADLRLLTIPQLLELADEIRQLIKISVSRNGGHLASNLGVVELTIALNYVFDFSYDRVVWDVGHQCYIQKILTGRKQGFEQLRQAGGVSGFPDPQESMYDQFKVGHAGTAVATAVGLAMGAQMQGTDEKVVAVVGDASIVNGISFEGLNNTDKVKRQLLIIMNDNSMAIDKTQGAFAQYLTRVRVSRTYEDIQRHTRQLVKQLPVLGGALHDTIDRIKGGIKSTLLNQGKFAQLGIPFYGPVDGHDLANMITLLRNIKEVDHPMILHVYTEKGRGFNPASQNPTAFHSTKPFIVDGETVSFAESSDLSFTAAFAHALEDVMAKDERVVAITAAMQDGTGLSKLRNEFPNRIIDVGIAESAAIDIAAGMAKTGLRPVVAIYSTFMQRCFDQIFQEMALQNLPVVLCMDRAGLVGNDGATHHGLCDIAMLRPLPNMILMSPMDDKEMALALDFAIHSEQPCAIRFPRDVVPQLDKLFLNYKPAPFEPGKAATIRHGSDVSIMAYGPITFDAYLAAESLAADGIEAGVISGRFAKPVDENLLVELLDNRFDTPLIVVDEHSVIGGFGSAILETAQLLRLDTNRIHCLGTPDRFIEHDTRKKQLEKCGLTPQQIADYIRRVLNQSGKRKIDGKWRLPVEAKKDTQKQ